MYKGKQTLRDIPGDTPTDKLNWLNNSIDNMLSYEDRLYKELAGTQDKINRLSNDIKEYRGLIQRIESKL